tara:strand:+ start:1646 stop:2248 length:603 start_codon:yes stop_codon:yes gene_type:complete
LKNLGPIYLIRHGETVWNRALRLQGHKDTPLTMRGVKQARSLGFALRKVLKNKTPSFFYSSPIGRAKQTATIISDIIDFDVEKMEYKSSLKEITFGDWDGLNMQEILAQYKTSWEKRKSDRWNISPPNGESFQEAKKRVIRLLTEIAMQQHVVIVAHGSLNKVIRGCWCNLSDAETLSLDEPQNGFYCLVDENREYFVSV